MVCVCVFMRVIANPKEVNTWSNYIHICDDKQVIVIRLYMWIINQSKDKFVI